MQLRPYQNDAVNAVYDFLRTKDTNPCVVAPTASGKSLMMAKIVTDAVTLWNGRVLLLAHVKELLEQNAAKIKALCPDIDIGIHSAGLGEAALTNKVIVAGIQSVYRKAAQLGKFDLVLIDECHLLPPSGDGMYRTFLSEAKAMNPLLRVIGFTATPYRLAGGLICKPENMLNEICYEIKIPDLIKDGYISKLISKEGEAEADLEHLHLRGGEFISDEIAKAMDSSDLVEKACAEIVTKTRDRKSVIIFGASVEHCNHIAECITRLSGEECPVVTGETPAAERADILARFKGEARDDLFGYVHSKRLKYLANVNVLTTGFDAPAIDCVVLLRPTASAALYVQMVGRGFRLAPNKTDCLILDYGGNVLRHGPVNDIQISDNGPAAPRKPRVCPECRAHVPGRQMVCPECGYTFPPPEVRSSSPDTRAHASTLSVVGKREKPAVTEKYFTVIGTKYFVHEKAGDPEAPKSLRIELSVEEQAYPIKLWKAPESKSQWARRKFQTWWRNMTTDSTKHVPYTALEAMQRAEIGAELKTITGIHLQYTDGSNFPDDVGYEFAPEPDPATNPFTIPEDWDDDLPF